jgi:hypothetical protein
MKFSLWTKYGALNSEPVFAAFKQSIINEGHWVTENDHDADVDVIWSVLWNGRMALNKEIFYSKKPTVVLEVGGIQRGVTWKICVNGLGVRDCLRSTGNDNTRVKQLGLKLQPWTTRGEHILICCQNPKSHQWYGMPNPAVWVNDTITTMRKHTDMPVVIRHHPRSPMTANFSHHKNVTCQIPRKVPGSYDNYDLTFDRAHAVIAWNSNTGPQALLHGIPTFTGPDSLGAGAADLDLNNIADPIKADRTQWLNDYVYTEHTLHEIASSIPLLNLLKILDNLIER